MSEKKSNVPVIETGFDDYVRKKRASESLEGLKKYAEHFSTEMNNYYSTSGWNNYEDAYNRFDNMANDFMSVAGEWRKKYAYNPDALSYISALEGNVLNERTRNSKIKDYYSQFATEDEYKNHLSGWLNPDAPTNETTVAMRKEKYESNKKRIEEIKASLPGIGTTFLPSWAEKIFLNKDADALKDELDALEAENNQYLRTQGVLDEYYVPETEEFLRNGANRNYLNPTKEDLALYDQSQRNSSVDVAYYDGEHYRDEDGNIVQYGGDSGVKDKLGLFLSASQDDIIDAHNELVETNGNYTNTWAEYIKEGDVNGWKHLTEYELNIYYDLLARGGQEAAYEFLEKMTPTLTKRATQATTDWINQQDGWAQFGLNAASIPMNVFGGAFSFADDAIHILKGEEINPYSVAHSMQNAATDIRAKTATDINTMTGNASLPWVGTTWGDVYQSVMSAGDSALGVAVGGNAYGTLMGMGAASSEMKRLYEQGASMGQIAAGGILAGAAEMVFEKYSIDKLVSMGDTKTIKAVVLNLLKQGGIEASEEMATEIANTITNAIVMGSQSDWVDVNTFAKSVVNAGIGGFISGSMSGGGMSAINAVSYNNQARKYGQDIIDTDGGVQALKDLANEVAGVSSPKMQKSLQKQAENVTDTQSRRNARNVGKLADNVRDANNIANAPQNQADIAKSLERKGIDSKTANAIAKAMVAQANGQNLTDLQARLLDKYSEDVSVQKARRNIVANEMSTMGQRSQNIRNFETDIAIGMLQKHLEAKAKETIKQQYTEKEFTPEGNYEVTTDGKALDKDGNAIDIKGVASISSEGMLLDIGDGKTVKASEVSYSSKDDALIYEAIENLGDKIDYDTANKLIAQYKGGNAQLFARGITQAYTYGYHGIAQSELTGKLASGLSREQINAAYKLGKDYRPVKDQNDATISKLKSRPGEKGVFYRDKDGTATDIRTWMKENGHGLKDIQKTGIEMMEKMSKMLGVRFNVFESWTENGTTYYLDQYGQKQEGDPNGFYDKATGEIYIDLHAGIENRNGTIIHPGTIIFTVAHELTHFMRQFAPAQFTKIAKIVFQHGDMKGRVSELVAEKQAKAKAQGEDLDYDAALEELVADGMETILKDGKVVEFMADVKQHDQTAWEKIKEWFKNLADFLREMVTAYSSYSAQSKEGKMVEDFSKKLLGQIERIWAKGAMDAGENYRKAQDAIDEKSGDQSTKFSNRQSEKNSLATEETVKYSNRKNFFPGNVFPPYNESHSDSHEVAERWARSEEGRTEKQRLLSHHGKWYVIQVVDDMDYGYQIIRGLTAEEYKREEKFYGTITRHQSVSDIARRNVTRHRGTNRNDEAGYRTDSGQPEHRGKNISVFGVDTDQDGRRKAESNEIGDNRSSGENRERRNEPSVKMRCLDELGARAKWLRKKIKSDRVSREKKSEYRKELRKVQNEMEELMPGYYPSGSDTKMSDRDTESVSNRSLLANAFEGIITNPIEKKKLQEYKEQVALLDEQEQKLRELNAQIKDLSFGKGPRDKTKIAALRDEAVKTANRIAIYDKRIFGLEAATPLQNILKREREIVRKRERQKGKEALAEQRAAMEAKQKETIDKWRESRKAAEANARERHGRTVLRNKIQGVVGELNQLLLNEDKKHHVPDSLKKAVADALALVNMDTVGADERIAKYADLIAKEEAKAEPDQEKIDAYTATMENILRQGEKMGQRLKELRDSYEEIQNSDDPDIANAYDPVIAESLKELSSSIGNTALRDMSTEQLQDVYDMYKMVLTRVRDANKSLIESIKEGISSRASKVVTEVRKAGGDHKHRASILDPVKSFFWNNAKPVYAMEHIGSATMTEAYNNVRNGEDTWAKDVTEARAYYLDKSKKYGYDSWDFDKKYTFESTSGLEFELTLEQIMALYAYSKRDQAGEHLRLGGFVFDSNIERHEEITKDGKTRKSVLKYKVNTADAHQISPEILLKIIGTLDMVPGAKGFVDEMQDYLSVVMGAKGNEVTMKMYGVKLFKEKHYFPLKSAKQFLFEQNEVSGEVRIKNSGFTNKTKPKANNPIILNNFMDVWATHVNDMSMYHSFVLPLEDFNRIFNYNSPKQEGVPAVSVKGTIQNAYSPAAVSYVKQLITDLNGGARSDPRETFAKAMTAKFKKAKVFSSLSVAIQQPSAIGRAFALVDPKYFRPTKDGMNHNELWVEVKKYAPVAIIKEMGYFDTNIGKSTLDFIKAKEYSTFKEKAKALIPFIGDSNYRDEALSKLPALADELAWCAIWNAVKRETIAKHHDLSPRSEEFLRIAGERFTEVITKTQVYDSVLARSANMRSKSGLMSMVTAFMAEPTTTINMLEDAIRKGKQGNKGYAARAFASVMVSIILNNALVALVYGMRDDDEDETYAEKYMQSFVSNMIDDITPLTYYPFVKDAWSLLQGYDVDRSDMSLVGEVADSLKGLVKAYSSENGDVGGAWWDIAGSVANIGGIPMQNIRREILGVSNIFDTLSKDFKGRATTKGSMADAIERAMKDSIPVLGWLPGETKSDKLYDAIMSGDTAYVNRLKGSYKDKDGKFSQTKYDMALRTALRENDPRIKEAALAEFNGNSVERMRITKEIEAERYFAQYEKNQVQSWVRGAINAEIIELEKKAKGNATEESTPKKYDDYTVEQYYRAVSTGKKADADTIYKYLVEDKEAEGYLRHEAEDAIATGFATQVGKDYMAGEISRSKAVKLLEDNTDKGETEVKKWDFELEHGFSWSERVRKYRLGKLSERDLVSAVMDIEGATRAEANEYIDFLDIEMANEDLDITANDAAGYFEYAQPVGISVDVYLTYKNKAGQCESDKDAAGKPINGSYKDKVMDVIDSLPITKAQKDALYFANDWAEKNLDEAPWH